MSKDLYENKDSEFAKSVLPEAKEIAGVRNFMEHKSFKVIDFGETSITNDSLTYQITRDELKNKTLLIIQMSRAALIYLSLTVHITELKKHQGNAIPVYLPELDYQYKI